MDEAVLLEKLLETPRTFHGKAVRIEGLLRLEFEGTALWVNRQEMREGRCDRALWIDLPPVGMGPPKELERFHDKRVALTGTLATDKRGHLGLFAGSLYNVKDVAKPNLPFQDQPATFYCHVLGGRVYPRSRPHDLIGR